MDGMLHRGYEHWAECSCVWSLARWVVKARSLRVRRRIRVAMQEAWNQRRVLQLRANLRYWHRSWSATRVAQPSIEARQSLADVHAKELKRRRLAGGFEQWAADSMDAIKSRRARRQTMEKELRATLVGGRRWAERLIS